MSLVWSQSCFNLRTWLSHPPLCKPQGFLSTELVISSMPSPQPTIQKGTHKDVCAWFAISTTNPDWWVPSNGCRHGWVPQTQRPGWAISYDLPFLSQQIVCWEKGNEHHHSSWTGHFLPEPATGGMLAEEFLHDLHEIPQPSCLIIRSGSLAFRC